MYTIAPIEGEFKMNRFFLIFIMLLPACNSDNKDVKPIVQSDDKVKVISDNFEMHNSAWKTYQGNWEFGNGEVKQTAVNKNYPLMLREDKLFTDVDVSVSFKPISGNIDASGGLVFRAVDEDNYYIVRANALENNFRLYTFVDGLRHQLSSATVTPPNLNQYHQIRVVAKGDHIQAYLNGKLELDYYDKTFSKGYTGLWTKEDSVTSFDEFIVSSVP